MRIDCPHCHHPIEVVNNDPLAELAEIHCRILLRQQLGFVGDASPATVLANQ